MGTGNCPQRGPVGRVYFFLLTYYACSIRDIERPESQRSGLACSAETSSPGQASLPQVDAALGRTAIRGAERSRAPTQALVLLSRVLSAGRRSPGGEPSPRPRPSSAEPSHPALPARLAPACC